MSHDLSFDVSHNGVSQPPSHDQQQYAMSGQMDGGNNMASAGGGSTSGSMLERFRTESAHPGVCFFHVVFKAIAMFLYFFGNFFTKNGHGGTSGAKFVTLAVICILLLAADFWTVKNITGRLLVGLRWWNKVEGDDTRWIFECADTLPNGSTIVRNKFDANIFWTVLYATPLLWAGFLFFGLIKFEFGWLIIVLLAMGLSCANVYGYYKCSKDQKAKFQLMMQQGAQQGAFAMMRSGVLGALTGATGGAQGNNNASGNNTYV